MTADIILHTPDNLRPAPQVAYPTYSAGTKNIEEYYYSWWQKNHFSCNRIYLPVFWTHYYIQHGFGKQPMPELDRFWASLDRNTKYYTVVQYDDGVLDVPKDIDLLTFSAGGKGNIPIPLLADGYNLPQVKPAHERNNLICFAGNLATHILRGKMAKIFTGKQGVVIHNGGLTYQQYFDLMNDSIFTLCPRGYGKTSFRTYEAIKAGSIPVYISNEFWIPYADELTPRWFIHTYERCLENQLYHFLGNLSRSGVYEGWLNFVTRHKEYFTMPGVCKYIKEVLCRK